MHYQLLNILRRFITGPVGRWLAVLMILLPLVFILSRFLGLSRQAIMLVVFGLLAIFVIIWAIGGLRKVGSRKRSKDFENDLGQHTRAPASQEEIREAVGELSEQWKNAMLELKEGRIDVYALPWFLLIGEPQSGKSTTLRESGLQFPIGKEALSGSGGTRNCDWWFTEEAVILDTAGRFSFQEEVASDRQEWEHFLGLLKKHRKECPINGVLVVIPATSLTGDTPDEQEAKAKNIRKKLLELQKQLEIRFPVFILITKADRVLGFTEFFAPLDPHDKGQIFGWSNPEEAERWDPESFGDLFADLVRRMHKIRLRLLRNVPDSDQADRMFVFPEELAALEEPLHLYFDTIFRSSRFEEPFIFRGFYLTSGLQEGRPIARACRDLLRVQAGDHQGVLEDLESIFARHYAFFIRDLYEKKVFPEQGLVRQTFKAREKDKRNKRLFYGLIGAAVVAAFLLLLPALIHMSQVLRPINQHTERAQECLDPKSETVCAVDYTWELIHDLEQDRRDLRGSSWKIRILLQGGINNEISNELLPTIQAGLMRTGVLGPLLESFEARSTPEIWQGDEPFDYDTYRRAFETRLRFDRYQRLADPEDQRALREGLSLEPVLRFLASRVGADPTPEGEEIDAWLADDSQFGDIEEIETVFQSVLHADERFDLMKVGQLAAPNRAKETFEAYWSMPVLARWDYDLIDRYLRVYQTRYQEILTLDPVAGGGEEILARFAELGGELGGIVEDGRVFLSRRPGAATTELDGDGVSDEDGAEGETGDLEDEARVADRGEDDADLDPDDNRRRRRRRPQAPSDDTEEAVLETARPGIGVESWQKNCLGDYEALRQIYERLAARKDIEEHCRVDIPRDWEELSAARQDYDHLYDPLSGGGFAWSEGAEALASPLARLAEIGQAESIAGEREGFRSRLGQQSGDQGRLEELERFYQARKTTIWAPVDQLAEFERSRPDPRFEANRGWGQANLMAALAAGLEILPPANEYLQDKFSISCQSCFSKTYAESFVRPANVFLGWANRALAPAGSVRAVRAPLQNINNALYNYLDTYIDRQGSSGGGGGLARPYNASSATRWPEFTRALRAWQLSAAAAPVSADGLTRALLEEFASANDRLRPLVDKMAQGSRRSKPVQISPELERTIEEYKRTVEVLDDDALEAWRQLALGRDGASLDGFHAFSRNRRLQRNSDASWLAANVEAKGSELLSEAIRPDYEKAASGFWRDQEACCRDRFPFITELELRRQRLIYERGYLAAGDGELWLNTVPDPARRVITLPILLETVSEDEIDRIFFPGGSLDRLFEEFVLDPLVSLDTEGNALTTIDFVGSDKGRLRVLRGWQRFLYGDDDRGRRVLGGEQQLTFGIQEGRSTEDRIYLGERVAQVDLFGPAPAYSIRPSTDAGKGVVRRVPLVLEDRDLYVTVTNEDSAGGWVGRLVIRGGPLKLLYFVHLANESSRAGGREWTLRVEVPDFERHPLQRLDALFDLGFERPLPGVLPDVPRRDD